MRVAILLAGGASSRMKTGGNKCLLPLKKKTVLDFSLEKFERSVFIDYVVIVSREADFEEIKRVAKKSFYKKVMGVVKGGEKRQESVKNGLKKLCDLKPEKGDIVIIHNGANPFFTDQELEEVIKNAEKFGAAAVAQRPKDTIKEVRGKNGGLWEVVQTLPRDSLVNMQTPQAIEFDLFQEAVEAARRDQFQGTDDVSLVERMGKRVVIVPASEENFKITDESDWKKAQSLFSGYAPEFRSGIGLDSHRFRSDAQGLTLGGLFLKNEPQFEANSDGDVVLHALYNAISSALGGGSLSKVADKMCLEEGIKDSEEYLKKLWENNRDFEIVNVALTLECKRPKIEPLAPSMKARLAKILRIDEENIGITATSGEGLTEFGKGMGVQCLATVMVRVGEKT